MSQLVVISRDDLIQLIEKALERVARSAYSNAKPADGPEKSWLSNIEAMNYLGLSRSTLARYRGDGRLPYSRIGNDVWYAVKDVEALLEAHRQNGDRR